MMHTRELKNEMSDLCKKVLPVCIDFDGTCVRHCYPFIGEENEHCVEVLKKWVDAGVGLILDTMRSGKELDEAVKWFEEREIPLYGIGTNPTQSSWTKSNKAYGVFSVDDRNIGTPLIYDEVRSRVDWKRIDEEYSEYICNLAKNCK